MSEHKRDADEKPQRIKDKLFNGARRRFITGAAYAALVTGMWLSAGEVTKAFIPSGVPSGGGSTLQATYTLVNTSGSTSTANWIAPSFGCPFLPGQVTTYPQLQCSDGTPILATIYGEIYYADGSLDWCGFKPIYPKTIAGGGSATVKILNGGTAPAVSSRTLADATSGGASPEVHITGQRNITGAWIAYLAHGISNTNVANPKASADIVTYANGPAGMLVRVRSSFEQSGAAHGQFECYWYLWILQDASGNYYGLEYMPMPCLPWYNSTYNGSTLQHLAFSAITLQNGATVLADFMANAQLGASYASTFTWNSGTNGANDITLASPASSVWGPNQYLEFSTTGSLPPGLTPSISWWQSGVGAPGAGRTIIQTNACSPGLLATITGSGSGTHTATPYAYMAPFGAEYLSETSGRMRYLQGAGSTSALGTYRWQFVATYWSSTMKIPPYNLTGQTIAPNWSTMSKQFNMNPAPYQPYIPATGERDDLSLHPDYNCAFLWTQAASDEQNMRISGLLGGTNITVMRDASTWSIPNASQTSYSGMPAANDNFYYLAAYPNSGAAGLTPPPSGNNTAVYQVFTDSVTHRPCFAMMAALFTAEPHFIDIVKYMGSQAFTATYNSVGVASLTQPNNPLNGQRGSTINGTFYQMLVGSDLRQMAWMNRDLGNAAWLTQADPENTQLPLYFSGLLNQTVSGLLALNNYFGPSSFWTENGIANVAGIQTDIPPWMLYYVHLTFPYLWGLHGGTNATNVNTANIKAYCTYLANYQKFVNANYGGTFCLGSYSHYLPSNISSIAQSAFSMEVGNITWNDTASPYFTFSGSGFGNYTLTANDGMLFFIYTIPGGITQDQLNYIRDVSGNNFNLAPTKGGSAIAPTNAGSGGNGYIAPASPPSTGCLQGTSQSPQGYFAIGYSAYASLQSIGVAADAPTLADMNTRMAAFDVQWQQDPKYYMKASYGG